MVIFPFSPSLNQFMFPQQEFVVADPFFRMKQTKTGGETNQDGIVLREMKYKETAHFLYLEWHAGYNTGVLLLH